LLPRLTLVSTYSGLGVLVFVGFGLLSIHLAQWPDKKFVPAQHWAQGLVLSALVAFSAIVQWKLAPRTKRSSMPPDNEGLQT
jgi:hypothetical protein